MLLQDHEKVTLTTPEGAELIFPYELSSNLPLMFLDHKSQSCGMVGDHGVRLGGEPIVDEVISILADRNANLSRHQKVCVCVACFVQGFKPPSCL